jgi:aspartate 1-decarboxylase
VDALFTLRNVQRIRAARSRFFIPLSAAIPESEMHRTMLKSKIHRATVAAGRLSDSTSLSLSRELLEAADLIPGERVDVVDITNGNRFTTHVEETQAGSGTAVLGGANVRLITSGDLVIIIGYGSYGPQETEWTDPKVVFVDRQNRITQIGADAAAEIPGFDTVRGDALID